MKKIVLLTFSLLTIGNVFSQSTDQFFETTTTLPVNLDDGTSYFSCTNPGTKSFEFTVLGVGTLTLKNALKQVKIEFDATCGGNLRDISGYIKSPSGNCARFYNGASMSTTWTAPSINMILANPSICLTLPNSINLPSSSTTDTLSSSNYGFFAAPVDLAATFNNENADGKWTIYWFETAINTAPCIKSMSIVFGDPTVDTRLTEGDNCDAPLVWGGDPICTSTNGKKPSAQVPGLNAGSINTIGGETCQWNGFNNNDVWIEFTPKSQFTCLGISGLQFSLQSIVVTDANEDGDNNPCTGNTPSDGNDPRWKLVSCPSNGIYSGTSGTQRNQYHCFTTVPGKKYFLVVDGNGNVESPFYISGIEGAFDPGPLPVRLVSFSAAMNNGQAHLKWITENEINHKAFEVERSTDGRNWEKIKSVPAAGARASRNNYFALDKNPPAGNIYYRLKQIDQNGAYTYSAVQLVKNFADKPITILPNPSHGIYNIQGLYDSNLNTISVFDQTGKMIFSGNKAGQNTKIDLTGFAKGVYYLNINNEKQNTTHKLIKN